MAEIGLRPKLLVKDVMTNPVITIDENDSVLKVAQLMRDHDIGSVIVIDNAEKPVGIITEKDLVRRVLTENTRRVEVKAKNVMTTPLLTIDPDVTLTEAARRMSKLNVRRLSVIYKGNLVGFISSNDVLAVMPELLETIQEQARIEKETTSEDEAPELRPLSGYCDHCNRWSESLKEVDGQLLCDECQTEVENAY